MSKYRITTIETVPSVDWDQPEGPVVRNLGNVRVFPYRGDDRYSLGAEVPGGIDLGFALLFFGGIGVLVWSLGDKRRRSIRVRRKMGSSRTRSRSR